jgi:hypothetical protein
MSRKPKPKELTTQEKTAYHEAGHAVVALCFQWPVDRMTILPSDGQVGELWLVDRDAPEEADPAGSIAFVTAGWCAELIATSCPASDLASNFWMGGEGDRKEAQRIARDRLGCKSHHGRILKAIANCVFEFIQENAAQQAVGALANGLLVNETLFRDGIEAIWQISPISEADVERFRMDLRTCCAETKP